MRRFDLPGRSPVIAENGAAATSHPLASATALAVLREGGNAVDAALAASATLAVVEPQMTGIGGDCFAIVAQPDGTVHGLNGSGRSARAIEEGWFADNGFDTIPHHSPHAVTVPGAVKAWETLHQRFGKLDFVRLFADAIGYAENGFAVAPRVADDWQDEVETLKRDAGARRHLLVNDAAPKAGDRMRFPALAGTLSTIAAKGAAGFYEGAVAREIAETVQEKGGFLAKDDLAAVTADWVEPIGVDYAGYRVLELPPSGQGMVALILFNLLDRLGTRRMAPDSLERYHHEVEAARLAYSVRDAMLADPDHMTVSVERLISRDYAEELAAQIDPERRNPEIRVPEIPNADTTYLTVVDGNGMAVSFINSVFAAFGSQIVTPESGVVLQNRGACFRVETGHPNAIASGKRPLHTIIPAMVMKDGLPAVSFGVMGGAYQPMGHGHVLSNLLDHGMDPQEALDHPRVFWNGEGTLGLEAGVSAGVAQGLRAMGHGVAEAASPWGGGQMIAIDRERGFFTAGSDPRKDGQAVGY
ncbi:gamma-glutamyltransferase [Pararhizobium mangrovi]|uniref:Glutathione hydrolase proenzyme n=1 Tax=Pararhizobium mangrovi TaxID=2590452 RepID=A0A506UDK3_9HYPH|nr:gamma-glutamyltransferase [Pararhizobium mangrovi]TPW30739.1 gamma-glutamyltransferase [Pararhizobium mangrovi]